MRNRITNHLRGVPLPRRDLALRLGRERAVAGRALLKEPDVPASIITLPYPAGERVWLAVGSLLLVLLNAESPSPPRGEGVG